MRKSTLKYLMIKCHHGRGEENSVPLCCPEVSLLYKCHKMILIIKENYFPPKRKKSNESSYEDSRDFLNILQ